MKRLRNIVLVGLFAYSSCAWCATAFWTGRMESVQTVTYQMAWKCEYNYAGQMFWRVYKNSCPSSVEVE